MKILFLHGKYPTSLSIFLFFGVIVIIVFIFQKFYPIRIKQSADFSLNYI